MRKNQLIKTIFFSVLTLGIVLGTFYYENVRELDFSTQVNILDLSYEEENVVPERGIVRFADNEGVENDMEVLSVNGNDYVLKLNSGNLWGNFTMSNANVNIAIDRLVLISDDAQFDLQFDGKKVTLAVFDGDLYVGFLEDGIELTEYVDQYSNMFINKLLVPKDTTVKIPLSKMDEKLRVLLYSKLVKEFKYTAISDSVKESDWVKDNLFKDSQYSNLIKQSLISGIIFRGTFVHDSNFSNLAYFLKDALTLFSEKDRKLQTKNVFSYLNDAIYYANESDAFESDRNWNDFKGSTALLPIDLIESDEFKAKYDAFLDVLSVFGPDDVQYSILEKMLEQKFLNKEDVYKVLNILWHDVYEGVDLGKTTAEAALNKYYNYLSSVFGISKDREFYKNFITFQNQLFDNLFTRYSYFYRDGYFAMKNILEEELLDLFEDGELNNELKQALINDKIKFLKRLMKFFFEGEIETVMEAKEILSRLVEEIDDLMPGDGPNVAVIKLFETELENIGDFYGYLSSPEYHISKTYGANHEERYKAYLDEKDKIWSFVNIQEEVLGENVANVTTQDVIDEVMTVFSYYFDFSNMEVGEFDDVSIRYVVVNGIVGGYPFEAQYDRDKEFLNDVYTYGELISDRPVKLDNLLDLLEGKYADFVPEDLGEEEYTEESFAQRTARLYVSEKIAEFGFVVEMEQVVLVDEDDAIYRIKEVYVEGNEGTSATFDFKMNNEKASNIYLLIKGDPLVMEDEYTLEELYSIVMAEGDFSVVDDSGRVLR